MATNAQINANRKNATHSTGPKTETGKANASRNHLTLGLYTRADYVKPEERDLYKDFVDTMLFELAPETLLEQSLAAEITGATWRLRRCSSAEAELADYALTDPLLSDDETAGKQIRSIERARSAAHSQLHRSINQLRKLQTEREIRFELSNAELNGLAVPPKQNRPSRKQVQPQTHEPDPFMSAVMGYCAIDPEIANETYEQYLARTQAKAPEPEPTPEAEAAEPQTAEPPYTQPEALASNCKTGRNHRCPCGSGLKFKRCCLRTGPAWQSSHPSEAFSTTPEPTSASNL